MVGDEAGSGQARVILVAGGTGRLGTLVVRELSRRGEQVRVLTRNPDRAAHQQSSSVDIVTGDVRHPASLSPAVAGVRVVVSAVQGFAGPGRGSPDSVDRKGNANLVAAAAAEGADVVLLSMVGAAPDSRLVMARAKFDAEESLKASGVPWTIVRSTPFLETWAAFLAVGWVFGRGRNPINFVAVQDVAAAVSRAVVDPSLRGETIEIAGPRNLTLKELASLMKELKLLARGVHYVPRWLLRLTAPVDRRAASALAVDSIDMTAIAGPRPDGVPLTQPREALRRMPQPEPRR